MFTEKDLTQFAEKGITESEVNQQIDRFNEGFPFLQVYRPATLNDGIWKLNVDQQIRYVDAHSQFHGSIVKFVPASGAASRMFKSLFEALDAINLLEEDEVIDWSNPKWKEVVTFFQQLSKFPFYKELKELIDLHSMDEANLTNTNRKMILEELLLADGMNYGAQPKGLLKFHSYKNGVRTAFEEHLVEAHMYATTYEDIYKKAKLHLAVSPEHHSSFRQLFTRVEGNYGVNTTNELTLSEQLSNTDTIALDLANQPFRDKDGTIVFRPAGHGALLANLNNIKSDLIFIKNIDNVVVEKQLTISVHWKKVLTGFLLEIRNTCFEWLSKMDEKQLEFAELEKIRSYIKTYFGVAFEQETDIKALQAILYQQLNRPIRVCGMVPNVGEPGGGPFIAQNADGVPSLQILESSQINLNDENQFAIFQSSTHFNPVDLVLSTINYKDEYFDLFKFTDPKTGFISLKTKEGKQLKAQELPGLWNGAMSNWNTVFVETPLETFNPVKTVNDLLRPAHQQ